MTSGLDWRGRVGDIWAVEWRRTDRSLADLSRHLDAAIAAVAPDRGHVLDIGSGAGATSLALRAVRPQLRITGADLSPELTAVARARAGQQLGDDLRFLCGDALAIAGTEAPFDMIVSRHGVMFFPDPVAAFAGLRIAVRDGATMVFSCFDTRAANGFAIVADEAIGAATVSEAGYVPGPFAFADMTKVGGWLEQAGWQLEGATRVGFDYVVGQGDDPVEDAFSFLSRIGPAARALAEANLKQRERIAMRLREALARYRMGDHIALPASAWIWRLRAASM